MYEENVSLRVFLRFFLSASAAGAVFLDVFLAAAGVLDADGCLAAVDDAGAFPAVEAGFGGMVSMAVEWLVSMRQ